MKIKPISILLSATLATLALSQTSMARDLLSSNDQTVVSEESEAKNGKKLKAALNAITESNMRADLTFLASDEMGGRDTPSDEQRLAARFIRSRVMRLGFTPAGTAGTFMHDYQLSRGSLDVAKCSVELEREGEVAKWEFGKQYYSPQRGNLKVSGGLIFGGSGTAEELKELDLEGNWVLVFEDAPDNSGSIVRNVKASGALGLMVASHPNGNDSYAENRISRRAGGMGRGGRLWVYEADLFPQIYVGAEALEEITFGDVPDLGTNLELTLTEERMLQEGSEPIDVENVSALWPGSDPKLAKEVLILSAHYDHVGQDEQGIFNGADDNGSGTAGLMAIAEGLKAYGPMKRSVLLLWVSGEEKGLLGSEAWAKKDTLPEGMVAVAALNIDMIGRNAPDHLLITPTSSHDAYNGLTRMAEKFGPEEGFPKMGSADQYWSRSDHKNFYVHMGVPVAFLFADIHDDYHQRTDTVEKIDFNKMKRITNMVVKMMYELQDMDLSEL